MTIKEVESPPSLDRRPACRLGMPPAGGGLVGLMARDAMELPPAALIEFTPNELSPLNHDDLERYAQGKKSKNGGWVEPKEKMNHHSQADITANNKGCAIEMSDLYVTPNVLNRLGESGDARKGKSQKNPPTDIASLNQPQASTFSSKTSRKETSDRCSSQERKKVECCQSKESDESFVRENIAGNNAGHYMSEELLPIQFTLSPDGPIFSSTAAPLTCATCGEGIPSQPGGVCKQCMHRGKHTDPKGGALDDIIAYAQNLAWNVKKLLTIKEENTITAVTNPDVLDVTRTSEPSQKLQRYQSEIARQRCTTSYVIGSDGKHPRKFSEIGPPAPLVYGNDVDALSVVDGVGPKDSKWRLEREASTVTSSDSRPPIARAKTKVKALFSSSRTKTFRSRGGRTRTDNELKNESVTSTLSCRTDGKRSSILETTRKSGRTQTFDSSNLHLRKDAVNRSRLAVMQEGTPVDPPINDDKVSDKAHKYAISRSATSPGTPGLKALQREKSNFGSGGPLLRTNTKLTLRANKAAVLRKENIHKATTLFHQQPAIDTSDGSPQLERKRGSMRHHGETRMKIKPMATISEKQSPVNVRTREVSDDFTTSVGSSSKQEAQGNTGPAAQRLNEGTDSEVYCGVKTYIDDSKDVNPYHEDTLGTLTKLDANENEIPEKNPYCDNLHHYGKGLEDQLLKQSVVEAQSNLAISPYFDKASSKATKDNALPKEEEMNMYTDKQIVAHNSQSKPDRRSSGQWYSLQGVTSKSSTQLREATRVRSSFSDAEASRSSLMGISGSHSRKHVKYSETDVDSGTIYHMAKRITSDQKFFSHNEFAAGSNFFETGGDVSTSSSSTGGPSSTGLETVYTGGFFRDAFDESEKKDASKSITNLSQYTYFEYAGDSKAEPIECDIYTGSVFSPSANNLALSGVGDNWKNTSTNNSNRLPSYRCRSRTTVARISNRISLNCSNNSSSFVKRGRSPSLESFGPKVTQALSSSYVDYTGCKRPLIQPLTIPLPTMIDFTKYDNIGVGDTDSFFSSSSKYKNDKDSLYEGQAHGFRKPLHAEGTHPRKGYVTENLYTPGDRNTNINNCNEEGETPNSNNNHFGDFYTGEVSNQWNASQEHRSHQASTSSGDFTKSPSPKYAPGSFYENAYAEPEKSPPRAQAATSSFFSVFTGYGEPPAQHAHYSPDYAGSFSHSPLAEGRSRSPGANAYAEYGRTSSASPKRQSYDLDGYFDYHSPGSREERRDFMDPSERSRTPSVPKIKRVGAIICRENVANKDDYAEDVNRDLMEDSWIPISYRLAAEQVKEMGGGRCSSRELFKTTEAKCDPSLLDASPFAQGQMLEALGRKTGGWNLKQNTDSLKEDISMKWRDAREKGNRQQQQQQQQQKKKSSDSAPTRTSVGSVWRPTDHIPAKARGNRTLVRSEPRGPTLLDGANTNNSRVWSAVMWVPSTVGTYVKKLW